MNLLSHLLKDRRTIQELTRRAEDAERDATYSKELAERYLEVAVIAGQEHVLLHDHALELQDRYHDALQELQALEHNSQADDEIARLSTDLALANNGIDALTQERDRLSDDLATAHSDLSLAYNTRDEAMLASDAPTTQNGKKTRKRSVKPVQETLEGSEAGNG